MEVLQTTKIILAWELFEQGLSKTHIAERLQINRDTVRLWVQGIAAMGLAAFLDRYTKAKKGPRPKRQVDPILKRRIWMIRDREMECC